jgi:hypothetical protein
MELDHMETAWSGFTIAEDDHDSDSDTSAASSRRTSVEVSNHYKTLQCSHHRAHWQRDNAVIDVTMAQWSPITHDTDTLPMLVEVSNHYTLQEAF